MTTALIGKLGDRMTKARVALLARQPMAGLASVFARGGHELSEFQSLNELAAAAALAPFDLVLSDGEAAGDSESQLGCPVIVLSDPSAEHSTQTISHSAFEASADTILALAVALAQSNSRCREMGRLVDGIHTGAAIVGKSPAIRRLLTGISRAADCDASVLIEGPSGSGKSLAARMVHCKSRRSNQQIVAIEAPTATAESLSKALGDARGTTLVIEEIDRLPTAAQAVLVKHLKERSPSHQGTPPRIIATTSSHLPEQVARGSFREDLFYRLHSMPLVVPSLRERVEDIAVLARSILEVSSTEPGKTSALSAAAITCLEGMSWPGNVAQLGAVVRRAQLLAGGATIEREHVCAVPPPAGTEPAPAPRKQTADDDQVIGEDAVLPFEQEEQRMLSRALRATRGNVRRAAQLLGIGRATLYRKIQQYNLRLQ